MIKPRLILLAALCAGCVACQSSSNPQPKTNASSSPKGKPVSAPKGVSSVDESGVIRNVKTTAYTQSESDHIVYGAKSAIGNTLKFGEVRSAAADWSVYPVGTEFKIEGEPYVYQVDDYGSALVGTETIDLYRPSRASMDSWGARHVNIKVLKWGSFARSLAIMKPRSGYRHIKQMISKIETAQVPAS